MITNIVNIIIVANGIISIIMSSSASILTNIMTVLRQLRQIMVSRAIGNIDGYCTAENNDIDVNQCVHVEWMGVGSITLLMEEKKEEQQEE